MTNDKKPPHAITFTVDNIEFTVIEKHQSASSIRTLAGLGDWCEAAGFGGAGFRGLPAEGPWGRSGGCLR